MRWYHLALCLLAAITGAAAYHVITQQKLLQAPIKPVIAAPTKPIQPPALPQAILTPAQPSPDQQVLSLFLPEEKELEHQQQQSELTAQMEQTLVITYVLANCKLLSQTDYNNIYQKLGAYLAQTAPDSADILLDASERARASYQFVYRRIPCNDSALPAITTQLRQWSANR
jgi:hypothetical protein